MRCRYYENQYPEPEEVVMASVTDIGEMGAYVTLLEYDDIEVISFNFSLPAFLYLTFIRE